MSPSIPHADAPLVVVRSAVKTYGSTQALSGVTLDVHAGEVLGMVGHNGAGKSTLMRVLSGVEALDSGSVSIDGVSSASRTGFPGVRMAYQETSLATELTVAQNVYLSSRTWMPRFGWRKAAAGRAMARLSEIFPGHTVAAGDYVDELSLAQRQMVEIARATIADGLQLLILDEPTESLGSETADLLYSHVRRLADRGVAVIVVSHRLREILSVSDRVAVLKDGNVVSVHRSRDVSEDDLFVAMGGEVAQASEVARSASHVNFDDRPVAARIALESVDGSPTELVARQGEVLGLAGIAGQGQEQILERLWRAGRDVTISSARAYVPGDRQRSGILPLWDVAGNLTITALARLAKFGLRRRSAEGALVTKWVDALKIRGGPRAAVVGLSGGNQQKVIVARAFGSSATIILLDDPFRGVDVHTKVELYRLIRDEAGNGRCIVWYSSENSEMQHCDRVAVIRANRVAGELDGAEITDERIIALSFAESPAVGR